MTLTELAKTYRHSARLLWERMELVTLELAQETDPDARIMLTDRLRILRAMYRESRDIANLLEHYYDKGYKRNERYTI